MQSYYRLNSEYEAESISKRDNHYYENLNGKEICIDEFCFEIQHGWSLSRFGSIVHLLSGQDFEPSDYCSTKCGIPYITGGSNIINNKVIINRWTPKPKNIAIKNDILIVCKGSGSGKSAILNESEVHIARQIMAARCILIEPEYIKILFDYHQTEIRSAASGVIPGFKREILLDMLVPVPPLNEQRRMIQRIHELEMLASTHQEIIDKSAIFGSYLINLILNCAIQGKLTKHDHSEMPVDLPCKDPIVRRDNSYYEIVNGCEVCIDDLIPFQIPENWTWQRLSNICSYIHRGKSPKYSETKKYPVIAQKCNQWSGVDMSRCLFIDPKSITRYDSDCIVKTGDILINSTGTGSLGRIGIYDEGLNIYELAVADSHVTIVRCYRVKSEYVYLYLISPTIQSVIEDWSTGSTNQKELPTKVIQSILVPIPPSDEQLRIQSKVKELKSLLNALE